MIDLLFAKFEVNILRAFSLLHAEVEANILRAFSLLHAEVEGIHWEAVLRLY